jgi:hypothetical protein
MRVRSLGRRELIAILGGAAALRPLAARAQRPDRIRRVGVLIAFSESDPINSNDIWESFVILGCLSGREHAAIPSHRRRPVPMAGMGPGLRREDKKLLPRPSLGYVV